MSPRQDPAGRRAAILDAALELIAESGISRTSHRAIAKRANVPLGSTTYYFPTLDALVNEALERVADRLREQMQAWEREIREGSDIAYDLARLVHAYLSDRSRALLEYELYLAAARTAELRPAARTWVTGTRELLSRLTTEQRAIAVTALLDGFLLESVATGETPSIETMRAAIAQQLGDHVDG